MITSRTVLVRPFQSCHVQDIITQTFVSLGDFKFTFELVLTNWQKNGIMKEIEQGGEHMFAMLADIGALDLATLIRDLSFPVVCCVALFWKMHKDQERHQTECDSWVKAIEGNTLVIQKLIDREEVDKK